MNNDERELPEGDALELWNLGKATVQRYEHGGARVWFEREGSGRDLVIDIYAMDDDEPNPSARREAILRRLGVPAEPKPQ